MTKRKTKPRHYYKGRLAQPLRPNETPESKIPLLLADLGARDVKDGLIKLAERHVAGFRRRTRGDGKRRVDPGTMAQFFELVDEVRYSGDKVLSITKGVTTIYNGVDRNHVVREVALESWITYYKNLEELERTHEREREESLRPLRERFEKNKHRLTQHQLDRMKPNKEVALETHRVLGQPNDTLRKRTRLSRRGKWR